MGCTSIALTFWWFSSSQSSQSIYDPSRKGQCNFFETLVLKRNKVQPIDYDRIRKIPIAQKQIKAIIGEASNWPCLPYGHMFRIGVDPSHPDIFLKQDLLQPYKRSNETLWLYIEHQYKYLSTSPLGISVVLYFDGKPGPVFIPYEAITWFDDPAYDYVVEPWKTLTE